MNYNKERSQLVDVIARFFGLNYCLEPLTAEEKAKLDPSHPINPWDWKAVEYRTQTIFKEFAEQNLLVCGGTITSIFSNTSVSDLDFYMRNKGNQEEIIALFKKYGFYEVMRSDNAITFKRKSRFSRRVYTIQLITRFVGDADEIFDWFDFTITQGAFDFHRDRFELGERFLPDIAKRKLVYLGRSQYPICAMYRTLKYQKKGYILHGATIMHIALSIVNLEIKTYGDLKKQLMGIDTMFLQNLLARGEYANDIPYDYGKFIAEAFEAIDRVINSNSAMGEDSDVNDIPPESENDEISD